MSNRLLQILVRALATVRCTVTYRSIALANHLAGHPNAFINTAKRLCPTTASSANVNLTEEHYSFAEELLSESEDFAALRFYCCPKILSDAQFWGCYFYLLAVERSVRHEVNLRNREAIATANAVADRQQRQPMLSAEATPQRGSTISNTPEGPSPIPLASADFLSPEAEKCSVPLEATVEVSEPVEGEVEVVEDVERRFELCEITDNQDVVTATNEAASGSDESYGGWLSAAAKLFRNAESHITEVTTYLDDLIAGEGEVQAQEYEKQTQPNSASTAQQDTNSCLIPTSSDEDDDEPPATEEQVERQAARRLVRYSTFVGFTLEEMPSSPVSSPAPPSDEQLSDSSTAAVPHRETMEADRTKMFANSQLFDELMRHSVAWSGAARLGPHHRHGASSTEAKSGGAVIGAGQPIVTKVAEPEDHGYEGYF